AVGSDLAGQRVLCRKARPREVAARFASRLGIAAVHLQARADRFAQSRRRGDEPDVATRTLFAFSPNLRNLRPTHGRARYSGRLAMDCRMLGVCARRRRSHSRRSRPDGVFVWPAYWVL